MESPAPGARLIDGKQIAAEVRAEVRDRIAARVAAGGRRPGLRVVLVGEHPASISYVTGKQRAADEVGMDAETIRLPESLPEADLLALVDRLNADPNVDGILVQLPLPDHIRPDPVIERIRPDKDVDGFHPSSVGRLVLGKETLQPCTPAGIVEMLRRSGIPTSGAHAVVLGRSQIVGTPMANLLIQKGLDSTVTLCHSRTRDLAEHTRRADILIAAIGQPRFVTADMVRDGAAVIDVGINRIDDDTDPRGYRLVGDVDFDAVRERAGWITPVPGGVGPMTIAMLLSNTLTAAERRDAHA
ncbi:MAG TPA: bifunctional methylenetetrahydrofolate dehydrogenase/methenyltetrahydrofolate cyclohydrolase FolD [Rhodothermales bacterium]|nr:bifunctional methylenetetrahydrofolate dehydrogenase/methenyltetrahydrofolate cyclohydrolase FolD [Rhodothermales bacterium]